MPLPPLQGTALPVSQRFRYIYVSVVLFVSGGDRGHGERQTHLWLDILAAWQHDGKETIEYIEHMRRLDAVVFHFCSAFEICKKLGSLHVCETCFEKPMLCPTVYSCDTVASIMTLENRGRRGAFMTADGNNLVHTVIINQSELRLLIRYFVYDHRHTHCRRHKVACTRG